MLTTTQSYVTYQGNGSTTAFPYNFYVPSLSDMVVTITNNNVSPAVTTVLSTSQYQVSGIGSGNEFAGGAGPGGIVTYPASGNPLPSGWSITIQRIVPYVQSASLTNQGAFYPQVVEGALDYLTMQVQQIAAAATGLQFMAGPQGLQGPQGIQGIQGITGPAGPAGASALAFSGLVVTNDAAFPATKIDISATSAAVTDGTGYTALYNPSVVINTAATGPNGMDVGALGSTAGWVHCYLIYNAATSTTAGLATLTSPLSGGPTMPSGYTQKRCAGSMYWTGTALAVSVQNGNHFVYDALQQAAAGTTVQSWTVQNCAAFIPPTSTRGYFQVQLAVTTGTNSAAIRKNNSSSTTGHYMGKVSYGGYSAYSCVNDWCDTDSSQNIQLNIASAASWTLNVLGFELNI